MFYNENECCIELSAEELCLLVAHPSNLDERPRRHINIFERSFDKFLSQMPDYDKALESKNVGVNLINTAQIGGIYYTVNTVADRAFKSGREGFVDRFVSASKYSDFGIISNFDVAILKTNAYFYATANNLSRVEARIVYCFSEDKDIKIIEDNFSVEELRKFYLALLDKLSFFGKLALDRKNGALPAARKVLFPYSDIRAGQEKMIKAVYRGIVKEKKVFVQAPTGIGKTISTLYPAVKALGEGKLDKIFYLTAKGSTAKEAFSAMKKLYDVGAKLKTIMIGSKDFMCSCLKAKASGEGVSLYCNSLDCEACEGYYDRRNSALEELLGAYSGYSQTLIKNVAQKYKVCPYELSLDLSEYCDVIICDYNYIFDPIIYFQRYFGEEADKNAKYAFLIDEAHNLFDRAIDMYSASLHRNDFARIGAELPPYEARLIDALDSFVVQLNSLKKLCRDTLIKDENGNEMGYYISKNQPSVLEKSITALLAEINPWLRKNRLAPHYSKIKSIYSTLKKFNCISELYDNRFVTFIEVSGGDIIYSLRCLDPSGELSLRENRAISCTLFSATLAPFDYYCNILGGSRGDIKLELENPFERENLCLVAYDGVSTRFEDREKSYKKIASCIAAALSGKAGNYIVFFPSYKYMTEVLSEFEKKYPKVKTVVQKNNMTIKEKEEFLSEFKDDEGILRVGFCVLGGSFSEGIDLPGSRLIGTVIVGVGLPGISNERNIMKEYFENTQEQGYDYAYTYPGFNRVLQAVGRVIRSEDDKGIAVLIDDRYSTEQYKNIFPVQWKGIKYSHSPAEIAEIAKNHWINND